MKALVDRLLDMYPAPPAPMIEEMKAKAAMIPNERIEDVYQAIISEASTSMKIGVKQIIDSCKSLGISTHKYSGSYIGIIDWDCDCCGHTFKYHPCPTDEDQVFKSFHHICPMCGFHVGWTITANQYMSVGHNPAWYQEYLDKYRSPTMFGSNGERGVFFNRGKRERELREQQEARVYITTDIAGKKRYLEGAK